VEVGRLAVRVVVVGLRRGAHAREGEDDQPALRRDDVAGRDHCVVEPIAGKNRYQDLLCHWPAPAQGSAMPMPSEGARTWPEKSLGPPTPPARGHTRTTTTPSLTCMEEHARGDPGQRSLV